MKTIKRTLAVLLTLFMLIGAVPVGMMSVSAANPTWTLNAVTEISDTNAKISSKIQFSSSVKFTEGGFYIGTSQSNLRKNAYPDKNFTINSSYLVSTFLMSKYKETLTPNTTYYYKIYVVGNGTTYTSPVGSFKTTGPSWTLNPVSGISTTDATISSKITFTAQKTFTKGGFYIGTSQSNMHMNAYPDVNFSITSTYLVSTFLMSKYHETLMPGTTYYYKIYVVGDGVTYESGIGQFTTLPLPVQTYNLTYDANGGSGAPATQTGAATYTISSTVPSRSGYTFWGWATNSSATTGQYSAGNTITLTANTTLYAVWNAIAVNVYNLGEETYGFKNYTVCSSNNKCNKYGHCFGMSATSSMYYLGFLNTSSIGVADSSKIHSAPLNTTVKTPICYYQNRQGYRVDRNSVVAGGKHYLTNTWDTSSDWNQVVNYVRSHAYDNKGQLQISIRIPKSNGTAGHAVNFLYYSYENGQDRIYAYDNNFPNVKTYFYMNENGEIRQAPNSTFSTPIRCIALRDMSKYFNYIGSFDSSHVIYADNGAITVEGVDPYVMDTDSEFESLLMYEIPDNWTEVTIIPQIENASFEYMDENYIFGETNEDTYGVFTLSITDDGAASGFDNFTIINGGRKETTEDASGLCPWCGQVHEGFFQKIIGFFHNILAAILGAKY
ncbi:MAG: InlB B-repeat-containing protein [Clostridia bacterium]|nr:InlB B-repeat-containing protein [Clostridia bacterium]